MSVDSESEDLRGSQDLFDRSPEPDSVIIVISSDSEAGSTEKVSGCFCF